MILIIVDLKKLSVFKIYLGLGLMCRISTPSVFPVTSYLISYSIICNTSEYMASYMHLHMHMISVNQFYYHYELNI